MANVSLVLIAVLALSVSCRKTEKPGVRPDGPSTVSSPSPPESVLGKQAAKTAAETDLEKRPADFFVEGNHLSVDGFTIEKRLRKERYDSFGQANDPPNWADVEYVVVRRGNRVLAKFDANLVNPLGNSTDFGLFPFLGKDSQQVFISGDLPRAGCQWILSLTPRFRVIFDGCSLGVGREGTDLTTFDFDDDGVYEIIAPITDFYALHDKLSMAAIPLPNILLKYDPARQKYLPANPIFKEHVFEGLTQVPAFDKNSLNEEHRSVVLSNLLIYVYAGEQKQGWKNFEKDYKLEDKTEMKRRVKAILKHQTVYKFIYRR